MSGFREFKLALVAEIGYTVRADGTTKYGRDYSNNRAYWAADYCDMGISYVAKHTDNMPYVGYFAYVPSHRNWCIKKGIYTTHLIEESLIFFDWNRNGEPNHIGWLEKVVGNEIHTIEFNHTRTVGRFTRPINSFIMGTAKPHWPLPKPTEPTPNRGDFYIA